MDSEYESRLVPSRSPGSGAMRTHGDAALALPMTRTDTSAGSATNSQPNNSNSSSGGNSCSSSRVPSPGTASSFVSSASLPQPAAPPLLLERSPPRPKYSDRFIPSRTGFEIQNALYSPGRSTLGVGANTNSSATESSPQSGRALIEEQDDAYQQLLRSEVLNLPSPLHSTSLLRFQYSPPAPGPILSSAAAHSAAAVANATVSSPVLSPAGAAVVAAHSAGANSDSPPSSYSSFGISDPCPFGGMGNTPAMMGTSSAPGATATATAATSLSTRQRRIITTPCKILDAPDLRDDFYLNLLDWGSTNLLAVGLADCVYMWNAATSRVTKLCALGTDNSVASVSWAQSGVHIAVGDSQGVLHLWDVTNSQRVRTMTGHTSRIGCLAWNSSILTSGSHDRTIRHHDIRSPEASVACLSHHHQEVCGLKWSPDGKQLASGGNDNQLLVWDSLNTTPTHHFAEHIAAVKAIEWSPHQHGLLASGGGTIDRCIRFWNTNTGSMLHNYDTGSQVCNLIWSKNTNELVSTHGFSQNQIIIWKCPQMTPLASLSGHTMRVLFLSMSPDGQTIVTGAGDETLRFWNIFPPARAKSTLAFKSPSGAPIVTDIR